MFSELLELAIGNLARARTRLFMTAGGVLVGTTAVILLIALTFGLQKSAEASIGASNQLTQINVYPPWDVAPDEQAPQLTVETIRQLWAIPGVGAVVPVARLRTGSELIADDYRGWGDFIGIDPSMLPYLGITAEQGTISLQPGEVLIGSLVGQNFYDPEQSGDEWQPVTVDVMKTPLELSVYQMTGMGTRSYDLHVAGVIVSSNGTYDYSILMPIKDMLRIQEWATGEETDPKTFTYDQVTVYAKNREVTVEVMQDIRKLGFYADGMGDYINQLNNFFVSMRLILGGVGGVALLVAAFGVANTMTMAILERTKEIGLMKAIGATNRDVLSVFLIEAGLVGLTGGVSGVGLSLLLRNLINGAVKTSPDPNNGGITTFLPIDTSQLDGNLIIIPTELLILAIFLATAVGIGAGFYPALRAAKLPPVIALKQE